MCCWSLAAGAAGCASPSFSIGTPLYREPGQLTLLLELVVLTEEEYQIASEQGVDALATRLRRRGVDVSDWCRQ